MIAREGLLPIGVAGVAAMAVTYSVGIAWSLPLWVLAGFLLYLFREFDPAIPNVPLAVLSPGDGRVVDVIEVRDPWLERQSYRVRLALDGLGIGVLRSPVEGKVMNYWTSTQPFNEPGALRATGFSPNCYSTQVQTDEGDDIVFAVSSLRPISRFKLYAAPGERIGIGQRSGFIYFGNIVDVYMPLGTRPEAAAGDAAVSGCTVLGHLVRTPSAPPEAVRTG
jgi:phosphatidylserine decarboxylase